MADTSPNALSDEELAQLPEPLQKKVRALALDHDNAQGRCKTYQLQSAEYQHMNHALQSELDKMRQRLQHRDPGDLGKAVSNSFATLRNVFKKRTASRSGSIDNGTEPLVSSAPRATDAHTAATTTQDGALVSAARASSSNGGGGGDGSAVTLGYNELVEQKLERVTAERDNLKVEVKQLRDLLENTGAELAAARQAVESKTSLYRDLETSNAAERTLRDALKVENNHLEESLIVAVDARKAAEDALNAKTIEMQELQVRYDVQGQLLRDVEQSFEWISSMDRALESQLMEAEDRRTQAVELGRLNRELSLLVDIQQSSHDVDLDDDSNSRVTPRSSWRNSAVRKSTTIASPTSLAKDDPIQWLCQGNGNLDCPNIVAEGWLLKAFTTKGKPSSQERYVRIRCLSSTKITLSYFPSTSMENMKRRLILRPLSEVVENHTEDNPLIFSVTGMDAHDSNTALITLVFKAKDLESKNHWVTKLHDCINYVRQLATAAGGVTPPEELKANFCEGCNDAFSRFRRRNHCYFCGNAFCGQCVDDAPDGEKGEVRRRCDNCLPDSAGAVSLAPRRHTASARLDTSERGASNSSVLAVRVPVSPCLRRPAIPSTFCTHNALTDRSTSAHSRSRGSDAGRGDRVSRPTAKTILAQCMPCGSVGVSAPVSRETALRSALSDDAE